MSNQLLRQILSDVKSFTAEKRASFDKAALVGADPASMPGAEHDSKVPEDAKKPQKEVKDETMVPNSGLSAEGAGDDSKLTRGHALDATQTATTPEKKPAVTADANAKQAEGPAKLANEILNLVRTHNEKAAAVAPAKVEEKAAEKPAEKAAEKPAEKAAVAPAKVEEKAAEKPAEKVAQGGVLDMVLTTDVMAKIAAAVLSTEEGVSVVESVLAKQAGAEAAQETLAFLANQSELAEKQAAFEQGQADAQALIDQQIYLAGVQAGRAEKAGQVAEDVPGAEAAAADMAEGAGAAEDKGITLEDVAGALEALVAEGQLKPEEAQEVMAALMAEGGEGAAATAEVPPAAEAATTEVPPAAEAAAGGEVAKQAMALLTAVRQLKK